MQANRILDTDLDLYAALILQAKVAVWRTSAEGLPELCEFGVRMEKVTPNYVKVRYANGDVAFYLRRCFDFYILT